MLCQRCVVLGDWCFEVVSGFVKPNCLLVFRIWRVFSSALFPQIAEMPTSGTLLCMSMPLCWVTSVLWSLSPLEAILGEFAIVSEIGGLKVSRGWFRRALCLLILAWLAPLEMYRAQWRTIRFQCESVLVHRVALFLGDVLCFCIGLS